MQKVILLIIFLPICTFSQIKVDRDRLYSMLMQGKTREVLAEAQRLREQVYGKCAVIDYFIAKSLCMDRHYDKSKECFEYILKHYPLVNKSRSFIESEINNCKKAPAISSVTSNNLLSIPLPRAGVSGPLGKMGFIDCKDSLQAPNYLQLESEEELESRLFEFSERKEALKKINTLLGDKYSVMESDRFILVLLKSQKINDFTALQVLKSLKKAYDFYTNYYNLKRPDKYITVYLMPDFASLKRVAEKIHGLVLPAHTLGYSILADLSLLGIATPDPDDIGTLYHELWHLIVRTEAGDISPWLDEGIASLYSTARWQESILFGERTWRTHDLEQAKYLIRNSSRHKKLYIANLKDFLKLDWVTYNGGSERNFCQASINYALANHLMLFVQEKQLLKQLVTVYKYRSGPSTSVSVSAENDITIMEKIFNKNIDIIQNDFDNWFRKRHGFYLYKN